MERSHAGRARLYLHTLGCPKNEADSRAAGRLLAAAGVELVDDPADATHILVNTCGFIQDAKEESIGAILDATASYPDKQVLVMGCLVQRYREELEQGIPEVAAWFGLVGGPDDRGMVRLLAGEEGGADAADAAGAGDGDGDGETSGAGDERPSDSRYHRAPVPAHAYVKISDGCDELCTFCAIPGIKGGYHAVTSREILADADACLEEGAKEIVLVGQDTARWESGDQDLVHLAKSLAGDPRLAWLRIMYLQPEHVTDGFLEYMGQGGKLCAYLDIPLQHSHPEVLRRMGRSGDGDSYLELLEHARRAIPGVAVRSAFIVGFPGETEAQFRHLLEFVRQAEFDYAGGFIYSPEEGTPAAALRPQVPKKVARERLNRLNQVLGEIAEVSHSRLVGTTVPVMVDVVGDGDHDGGPEAVGRLRGQAPEVDGVVHIEGQLPDGVNVGDVIDVTIEAAVGYDFVGTWTGAGGSQA